MDQDHLRHLTELRSVCLKRLRVLEVLAATQGLETPVSTRLEIEQLGEKIAGIDQELAATKKSTTENKFATSTTASGSSNLIEIEIVVKGSFESLTPEIRRATVRAVAALANIPAEQDKTIECGAGEYYLQTSNA
jgi:hypothetical protein